MGHDPNLIWGARTDALYGLMNLMQRAWSETGRLKVPTLYAYGAKDQIIPKDAAFHAAAALPPQDRTAYYADGYHLLLIDLENPRVWDDVAAFIKDPAAPLPSDPPPIPKSVAEAKALDKGGPKPAAAFLPQPAAAGAPAYP
jgi:alpha-beta hydrolase superfamily lysophospholipase